MPSNNQPASNRLPLVLALVVGMILGAIGWTWLLEFTNSARATLVNSTAKEPDTVSDSTAAADAAVPLGQTRKELLDALAAQYPLTVVKDEPNLTVVAMGDSGVSATIQGPADAPVRVNATAPYAKETAPTLGTGGRLLAIELLGDADWYGTWVADAVKRCDVGFDVVGKHVVPGSGTFEVQVSKVEFNGGRALSIRFRRLRATQ